GEDVFFAHEQQLVFVADFEGFAGPRSEQDAVASLNLQLTAGAVVEQLAVADGFDDAAGRLLFGRVGQDDATSGSPFAFFAADNHAVAQRLELEMGFGGLTFFGQSRHASRSSEANE